MVSHDNNAIARRLSLSRGTARKHLENAFTQLGVFSRTAAIARALPRHHMDLIRSRSRNR